MTVIVDDDQFDRYVARNFLSRRREFGEIEEAVRGEEFLAQFCQPQALREIGGQQVLVLMDLNMPGIDGFETIKRLTKCAEEAGVSSSMRVVVFTSSDDPRDRETAEKLDIVDGYLTKPLDEDSLDLLLEACADPQ